MFTPTYTGLGERVHLTSPDIDLHTHVQDVRTVFEYEDLSDVVLMGWSCGGMIVAAVAAQAPDRIRHVVVLDGYVPEDGESIADIVGPDVTAMYEQNARSQGSGWLIYPDWDDPDPRFVSHPPATIHTRVALDDPVAAAIPGTFIYCTELRTSKTIRTYGSRSITRGRRRQITLGTTTRLRQTTASPTLARSSRSCWTSGTDNTARNLAVSLVRDLRFAW